jgi:hypothetical protein
LCEYLEDIFVVFVVTFIFFVCAFGFLSFVFVDDAFVAKVVRARLEFPLWNWCESFIVDI